MRMYTPTSSRSAGTVMISTMGKSPEILSHSLTGVNKYGEGLAAFSTNVDRTLGSDTIAKIEAKKGVTPGHFSFDPMQELISADGKRPCAKKQNQKQTTYTSCIRAIYVWLRPVLPMQ